MKWIITLFFVLFFTKPSSAMQHPDDPESSINPLKALRVYSTWQNLKEFSGNRQYQKYGQEDLPGQILKSIQNSLPENKKNIALKKMNPLTASTARKDGLISFGTKHGIWIDYETFIELEKELQEHVIQTSLDETNRMDPALRRILIYDVSIGLLSGSLIKYGKRLPTTHKTLLHNSKFISAAGLSMAIAGPYLLSCTSLEQELNLKRFAAIQKNFAKNGNALEAFSEYYDQRLLYYKDTDEESSSIIKKLEILQNIKTESEEKKESKEKTFSKKLAKLLKKHALDEQEMNTYKECISSLKTKQFGHNLEDKEGPELSDHYLTPLMTACKQKIEKNKLGNYHEKNS